MQWERSVRARALTRRWRHLVVRNRKIINYQPFLSEATYKAYLSVQVVVLYPCTTRWCHVLSACSSLPCEHGGSCEDTNSGGFTCACTEQYQGPTCATSERATYIRKELCILTLFVSWPSWVWCINLPNILVRLIKIHFCNQLLIVTIFFLVISCFATPCQHGGTCGQSVFTGQYVCLCEDGYTGEHCETGVFIVFF